MRSVSAMPYLLMAHSFCNPLPSGFRAKISSQWRRRSSLNEALKLLTRQRFTWRQSSFLRLLMVGQKRQLQLAPIFQYELCNIPPSHIDEYGCLWKGNKSILANLLGLKQVSAPAPDIVIVNKQHMFYHIVWPHGGDVSDLSENIKRRLSCYCTGTEQVLIFDKYDDMSATDHKRMRHAGEGSTDYNLTANSPLPNRHAILKSAGIVWLWTSTRPAPSWVLSVCR